MSSRAKRFSAEPRACPERRSSAAADDRSQRGPASRAPRREPNGDLLSLFCVGGSRSLQAPETCAKIIRPSGPDLNDRASHDRALYQGTSLLVAHAARMSAALAAAFRAARTRGPRRQVHVAGVGTAGKAAKRPRGPTGAGLEQSPDGGRRSVRAARKRASQTPRRIHANCKQGAPPERRERLTIGVILSEAFFSGAEGPASALLSCIRASL